MKLNLKSDLKFYRFAIYFFFQIQDLNLYHEYDSILQAKGLTV